MARSLVTTLNILLKAVLTSLSGDSVTTHGESMIRDTLASGTAIDQADQVYLSDGRTLATTVSEELDLSGSLVNEQGETVAFTKVKFLLIQNDSTDASCILSVGGAASNGWISAFGDATDKIKVGPGGKLLLWNPSLAGYAVTAGTADKLKIENPGTATATYSIIIGGVKA
jgi:hypothetical protein